MGDNDKPEKMGRAGASAKRTQENAIAEESPRSATPLTLTHPISPPMKKRRLAELPKNEDDQARVPEAGPTAPSPSPSALQQRFRSPFQLTRICDLPPELNRDTVTLKDILGDPLIAECWEFNYLHDIDFLLAAFDQDVRSFVKIHVVHGFWKKEDPNRLELENQASQHKNVVLHSAYLPEMFGTHHTKMMILLRRDDTAQIVIHTANMIVRDWTNMTQAVWRSPMLPLLATATTQGKSTPSEETEPRIGSGEKFKIDFLNYLRSYDNRRKDCKPIIDQLTKYDFSAIRGALIGSVPGRHEDDIPTRWGWPALKQALKEVPVRPGKAEIAIQISSIATLGPTDNWLKNTLFDALRGSRQTPMPDFKVLFPTPDEIRKSLDGYGSGGSIHTKIQSAQQAKQLQYLHPIFCHWANDSEDGKGLGDGVVVKEAGRKRAAPHIKTYIRYGGKSEKTIDWALVTSANLSKQAWGEARANTGEVRIASYELGVLVWPGLYAEDAVMSAAFLEDTLPDDQEGDSESSVVSLRMPYNLPLQPYGNQEVPWVATVNHDKTDWKGQVWQHR